MGLVLLMSIGMIPLGRCGVSCIDKNSTKPRGEAEQREYVTKTGDMSSGVDYPSNVKARHTECTPMGFCRHKYLGSESSCLITVKLYPASTVTSY